MNSKNKIKIQKSLKIYDETAITRIKGTRLRLRSQKI